MSKVDALAEAIAWLEKANADLEPELMTAAYARERLAMYSRVKKLGAFGETLIARKVDDAKVVARTTGVSMGQAKATVETAKALRESDAVSAAFGGGDISFEQASVIAKADVAKPGSADELLKVAKTENFNVLKEQARRVVLETEQHKDLFKRQREAREARHYMDELGMVHLHMCMTPSLGTTIVNRGEDDARRMQREARREGREEPFERHLCDAFGAMLAGAGTKAKTKRPELVILVSHEITKRGWRDVREGELCKIPGVGPVSPQEAKEIAQDAFLSGVFFDGKDLRQLKSWSRDKPVELQRALNLGPAPDFDGVKCVDCGNRFRPQGDHIEPHNGGQNPTCLENNDDRCYECHLIKTEKDRKAGKLGPEARKRGPAPGLGPAPDYEQEDDRGPPPDD